MRGRFVWADSSQVTARPLLYEAQELEWLTSLLDWVASLLGRPGFGQAESLDVLGNADGDSATIDCGHGVDLLYTDLHSGKKQPSLP